MTGIRPYWLIFRAGIRQQSTYRMAMVGGLVANLTFGFLKVAMLFATVRAGGGEVAGYDLAMMSTYIWLGQGLLGSVNLYGRTDLALRIRSGDVTVDFLRPVDVHLAHVVTDIGKGVWSLLPRGLPSVVVGAVFVGLALPSQWWAYPLGALSVLIGIGVSAATVYLVGVSGFWLIETRGAQTLYMVVSGFLAGLFVPISMFPRWLELAATATPFPSMMMYPIDVLSGRVAGWDAVGVVAVQVIWLMLMLLLGRLLTAAGRRRLEVQGG